MVHIRTLLLGTVILSCAVGLPNTTRAQGLDLKAEEEDIKIGGREYSPYLNRGYPQRVFWGDTYQQRVSDQEAVTSSTLPLTRSCSSPPTSEVKEELV